jgi:2'-5' RNA ligase
MKGFKPARNLLRLFVAVDIGDEVRTRLAEEVARLKHGFPDVKWVTPDMMHLTLAFLGDVRLEDLADLRSVLARVMPEVAPFPLAVTGLGYFGQRVAPRVIWAGVSEGQRCLAEIQQCVARALPALGVAAEGRPFHAHVTLGRTRSLRDAPGLIHRLEASKDKGFGVGYVESVNLMSSVLQSTGPLYAGVSKFDLVRSVALQGDTRVQNREPSTPCPDAGRRDRTQESHRETRES